MFSQAQAQKNEHLKICSSLDESLIDVSSKKLNFTNPLYLSLNVTSE